MKPYQEKLEGNQWREEFKMEIANKKGRTMAATVAWQSISSDQQSLVDAEIENLLAHFVDQQIAARKRDYAAE